MLGIETLFALVVLAGVLCVGGICCACLHLPLCPLFCLAAGYGAVRAGQTQSQRRTSDEELGTSSTMLTPEGYRIVSPHEVREYNAETGTAQARIYNSLNYRGDVSDAVAEAYLLPPLRDNYVEASVITGTTSSFQYQKSAGSESPVHSDDGGSDPDGSAHPTGMGFGDYGMFRDVFFAIVFLFNTAYVMSIAFDAVSQHHGQADSYPKDFDAAASQSSRTEAGSGGSDSADESSHRPDIGIRTAAAIALGLAFFAIVSTSSVFMSLIMSYSAEIISASVKISIALFAVLGALSLYSGSWILAIVFFAVSYMTLLWLRNAAERIAFASTVLKTAITAVRQSFCGLMSTTFLMLVLQTIWIFIWAIAVMDIHNRFDNGAIADSGTADQTSLTPNDDSPPDRRNSMHFAYYLMVFQLFWGVEVCKNIVSSTVSGTLACWWFTPTRDNAVGGAFFRSLTTSFGCICFGSMLVSIVATLRWALNIMRGTVASREDRSNSQLFIMCGLCVVDMMLKFLERILQYFNKYAFTYVAAYGTNFLTSGLRVTELFRKRGWTALINDSLISNVLSLLMFAVGLTTGTFASVLAKAWEHHLHAAGVHSPVTVLFFAGFVIGIAVGVILSDVIDTAVACVFVFFAEDPRALQMHHPEVYAELLARWVEMHPTSLVHIAGVLPHGFQSEPVAIANPIQSYV